MLKKDTSTYWAVRSLPNPVKKSLTRKAKNLNMTNAEFLIMVDSKLNSGEWLL